MTVVAIIISRLDIFEVPSPSLPRHHHPYHHPSTCIAGFYPHCKDFDDVCRERVDSSLEIARQLLTKMHQDGVGHVIYMAFFYMLPLINTVNYGRSTGIFHT